LKPLAANDITGNWATLLSAWKADDSLDVERIGHEIDTLIEAGVDGIYSNGTAGEFHAQTESEFDQVSSLLASKCNASGTRFQIGVSHMSAQISLERLRRIVALAPGAVQIILPDWFPLTDAETISFLERMADTASGIGLILYNPPHAKKVLSPAAVGTLANRIPQLIGLKSAGGDDEWFAAMRKHIPQLSVFIPGHLLASGFQRGACGSYSNVACLNPRAAQHWWNQMQANMAEAIEVEQRLQRFMKYHISPFITEQNFCNAACDRLLSMIGGWADVGEHMRWPYRSIPAHEAGRLRPIAQDLIPEFVSG
jgi:4-hydroxy-tetrahydrodipicolinate synthase